MLKTKTKKLTIEIELIENQMNDFEKAAKIAGRNMKDFMAEYFKAMYENGITNDVFEHAEHRKQQKIENEKYKKQLKKENADCEWDKYCSMNG